MIQKNNNKENFLNKQRLYNRLFKNEDHYGVKENWHGWAGNFHRYRIKVLRNLFINIKLKYWILALISQCLEKYLKQAIALR